MTFNFAEQWLTVYSVLDSQKSLKKTLPRPLHTFKVEENSKTFQDLHRNLTTFQGKMESKDFSRTFPKIQGFFKTVWTLCRVREKFGSDQL